MTENRPKLIPGREHSGPIAAPAGHREREPLLAVQYEDEAPIWAIIDAPGDGRVADVGGNMEPDEALYYAHLFAAAPDMLAVLEEIAIVASSLPLDGPTDDLRAMILHDANAAIAKARGE